MNIAVLQKLLYSREGMQEGNSCALVHFHRRAQLVHSALSIDLSSKNTGHMKV